MENEADVDAIMGTVEEGDYVSHALYHYIIAEDFEKRSPSRSIPSTTAYFCMNDPITGTLTASKDSAKASDQFYTIAMAFFASFTRATLDDDITAAAEGDTALPFNLLS